MDGPHDDNTLVLGIESSCDETAASVVRGGREVLSSIVASQHDLHRKFGGVVPEIASRAHIERIIPVLTESLDAAGVTQDRLSAIAVGHRPGLIGSLLVGVAAAKTLAWTLGVPLVGVDHIKAHLYAAALNEDPIEYPAIGLVVSGGHTSLYDVRSPLDMRLCGRTIDDAVGEAYDKVAAILELGFPGGPIVDKMAQTGEVTTRFPRTLLDPDSLDFSFSGVKTSVLYHVRGQPVGRGRDATFEREASALSAEEKANVCASFQEAVADVLTKKLGRVVEHLSRDGVSPRSLVIGGGVSANSLVRSRCVEFGAEHGLAVRLPAMKYCIDNAAMIAGLGHHQLLAGQTAGLDLNAVATTELN
ncbi:MAG: tRNA (adenosine(37)-N6)-threonylcarbamoyltransferase complex transferase subunit TsaD [Phycisphaera sp.]|nr:tRNA (adenosine(37)-N6)-threonylcarbamoyltransferase complex transferase subunit TsaD [Phycisphaera sp.]